MIAFNTSPRFVLPGSKASLVVEGDGIEVGFIEGRIVVRSGTVQIEDQAKLLPWTAASSRMRIGDLVLNGLNAGWIYCETQNKEPFLVAPKDSGVMRWGHAMDYAAQRGSTLPTKHQLDAMYEARETGGLKSTFNITGSWRGGWYWSATEDGLFNASCQKFSCGAHANDFKLFKSSVRCVRRYSIY